MEGYRTTLDLRADSASTEQLREAMIRHRGLFEDLTGLREGRGAPTRDRVAAIRGRTAGTAEPAAEARVTQDPVAEDPTAEDRDLAARNDERAAENAGRTGYPPS